MLKDDLIPSAAVAVDVSSEDFDCTEAFAKGPRYARRLYIGTGGTVTVIFKDYPAVEVEYTKSDGSYLDGQIITVKTGGTADDIVAEV
jgi:hypothetical protein